MAFTKAQRRKSRARVAICGPSGSGKSMSALLIAKGLGGKIAAIDTEHGSLSLYDKLVDFDVCELGAPFSPDAYIRTLNEAEKAGYDTVIIDSLTHEWNGPGGILSMLDNMTQGGKNSFTAWKDLTPKHDRLIQAMLASPCNIIATMRTKTGYVLETNEKGKQTPRKTGMEIQQRDGMDYEFTLVFDVAIPTHVANASKDRTSLFDGRYEILTEEHGKELGAWLDGGIDAPAPPVAHITQQVDTATGEIAETGPSLKDILQELKPLWLKVGIDSTAKLTSFLQQKYSKAKLTELTLDEAAELLAYTRHIAANGKAYDDDAEAESLELTAPEETTDVD